MTFDDILEQVIALLKRQGRVSYPALKIRFSLDDEYLEALKAEIIEAQQLATDENGRVLVWTGNPAETSAAAPPLAQTTQSLTAQEQPSPEVTPLPTVPSPPDAERRQLTVMFCDLVDSTKLSSQLDPEEYREVVRAYQSACTEVIQRFDGHVAQLLGDGLLVYFGYPHAHEDDAQRAVRTGLGILAAMGDLNTRLKRDKGITLAIRLGIHTGLVVIGAMGDQGRHEQLALGETPNIAARLQGLAQPHTLAVREATSRLVEGYFTCESLGEHLLRGVPQPLNVYRVLGESGVHSRLDVAQPRGLTPLVGRESEVTLLLERWEQAKSGQGQVVLLSGDAGIGKSRLVQTLRDQVANEPHTRWECRSTEHYQNTALFPLTDLFHRLLRFQAEETPDEQLGKLEQMLRQYRLPLEESVPLFAPLLSLPLSENRYPLLNFSPQRQRQKTLESLVAIMVEIAERQPLLFILEDLHWTDPTTLEFLNLVIEQIPTTSILTVLTCRPHFQPAWHHRSYITEMTLNHLSHAQVEQIVNCMTDGKTFPTEMLQQIITKTDGVPLFVEEVTKAILESGQLKETDGHYEQATYTFKHALIQDAAYESLLKSTRQQYHRQIAHVLEVQFPETTVTQSELVAHHYTEASLPEQAVPYWQQAGQNAIQRSAHVEAIIHHRTGLALLQTLPETPERTRREVDMLIALGASLLAVKGYATGEVRETYTSAQQLCQHLDDPHQLFPVLRGLWNHYTIRAEHQTAHTLGEQLLSIAQQVRDASMMCAAHRALGTTLYNLGTIAEAHTHFTQGLALYDLQQHRAATFLYGEDSGVMCQSFAARALWHLGYPDQALAQSHEAVTLAQQIVHPFSLGFALVLAAMVHQYRREVRAVHRCAEATLSLATAQGFPLWRAQGAIFRGWTLAQQAGQAQAGIEQLHQGLSAFRATGAEINRSYWLAMLAEAYGTIGEPGAGLTALAEALTLVDKTGEGWYEPEVYRLKGELLLQQSSGNSTEAETCFHHAISIAQSQQAKSWELRAVTSLARLWHQQGKRDEARQMLGDVYGWFTEGFETADLKDARALLDELA